ncbi:MAG: SCO family protein [Rhodospirillaceae bacterium]|nr:SCO family protein [Rhodospirillaceae bacterium]MDE0618546.1 SCO family protein [Rhodospirillaceae bacterium]
MSKTAIQALLVALIAAVAAAAGVYLWRAGDDVRQTAETRSAGKALIGGPFALVDHTGTARTEKDLLGKFAVVNFGFTNCPDVCPTTLQTISDALELMGPSAQRIRPVFVSVDPDRDTPERLTTYREAFDERILMLTGSEAAVARAAKAYKVGYSRMKPAEDGSYMVNHTALIYLMGPDGGYITHFPFRIAPDKLAAALKKWVARES